MSAPASTSSAPVAPAISATVPDWRQEACSWWQWQPAKKLMGSIRRYQRWKGRWGPVGWFISKMAVLQHRFWSVVCGACVPINTRIGGGVSLPHPNGIVIHSTAVIGVNCLIFHQVTIGTVESRPGAPRIGGHVDIGAGAKILGPVTIGDHAKIGANAVVLCDVPAGAVAVGVPARILPRS